MKYNPGLLYKKNTNAVMPCLIRHLRLFKINAVMPYLIRHLRLFELFRYIDNDEAWRKIIHLLDKGFYKKFIIKDALVMLIIAYGKNW